MKSKYSTNLLVVLLLITLPLLKAIYNFDSSYLDIVFWPLAALTMVLSLRKMEIKSFDKFISFLLFYALATNAIEIFLFIFFGRLPEEGYPNSISVRFGGWLDAPNDFAALLFLLMGWSSYRYQGVKRILIEGSLGIYLILTQSLTGYVFLAIVLALVVIRRAFKNYHSMALAIMMFFLLGILAFRLHTPDLMITLMQDKSNSIDGHVFPLNEWISRVGSWGLFGNSSYQFYENWWGSALVNFGVLWFVISILAFTYLLFSVWKRFRCSTERTDKAVLCGFTLFSVYCVVGSLNLPFLMSFPNNFLLYVFCFLVLFGKFQGVSRGKNISGVCVQE
jgi:hypothetical protein